ncbi:hypothetical protein A2U01_0094175, partial [Trifolium medium]|nr:hypothetical protein [Trifolium medium]
PSTHSRRRSNAAAIGPLHDQSKTPTAIITQMSIHVELEEVRGRGTLALAVTVDGGGLI